MKKMKMKQRPKGRTRMESDNSGLLLQNICIWQQLQGTCLLQPRKARPPTIRASFHDGLTIELKPHLPRLAISRNQTKTGPIRLEHFQLDRRFSVMNQGMSGMQRYQTRKCSSPTAHQQCPSLAMLFDSNLMKHMSLCYHLLCLQWNGTRSVLP